MSALAWIRDLLWPTTERCIVRPLCSGRVRILRPHGLLGASRRASVYCDGCLRAMCLPPESYL